MCESDKTLIRQLAFCRGNALSVSDVGPRVTGFARQFREPNELLSPKLEPAR